jgi:hypothetical protein
MKPGLLERCGIKLHVEHSTPDETVFPILNEGIKLPIETGIQEYPLISRKDRIYFVGHALPNGAGSWSNNHFYLNDEWFVENRNLFYDSSSSADDIFSQYIKEYKIKSVFDQRERDCSYNQLVTFHDVPLEAIDRLVIYPYSANSIKGFDSELYEKNRIKLVLERVPEHIKVFYKKDFETELERLK